MCYTKCSKRLATRIVCWALAPLLLAVGLLILPRR
nr:MAG TPA: hypothetical protein [Caudoviricetes sp.]DAV17798.1 MAG TPA: hypothetical protein [Caudoviricetes sp.]